MRELYKKFKREIWVGVVVSLITAAIMKFGDWLIAVIPSVGISIFETISNILYSLAATHTDNLLLRVLLIGSFGLLAGAVAKSVVDSMRTYSKALKLEKKSKKFTECQLEEINKEVIAELNEQEGEAAPESIAEIIERGKKLGKSAMLVIVLTISLYAFITFFVTTPMSLYNKFEQDIVKIAPYVEECEIMHLKSDWVCMRSKADYDELYKKIDAVILENGLPK